MATARVSRTSTTGSAQPLADRQPRTRHLRVVRPEARRLALRISPRTGVVLTVLLFAALFAVAVSHALLIENQMDLEQLDARAAAEQARYERLRLDVAELESPDRIVGEAQDRLGMVPADEVVWLTPDRPMGSDGDQGSDGEVPDTPATSWADIKPYLEPAP